MKVSMVVKLKGKRPKRSYVEILRETQGAWAGDDWPKTEKRRRKIELKAVARMRKPW